MALEKYQEVWVHFFYCSLAPYLHTIPYHKLVYQWADFSYSHPGPFVIHVIYLRTNPLPSWWHLTCFAGLWKWPWSHSAVCGSRESVWRNWLWWILPPVIWTVLIVRTQICMIFNQIFFSIVHHYGRAVIMFGVPYVYTQSRILKVRSSTPSLTPLWFYFHPFYHFVLIFGEWYEIPVSKYTESCVI